MVKKLFLSVLVVTFVFAGLAYAQTDDELSDPGILPDSSIYFLKSWSENVGTFFTFGELDKSERYLALSEKRLAESKALLAKNQAEVANRTLERYRQQLNQALEKAQQAKENGLDTDEVMAKVSEATLKHQSVLADVYQQVPAEAQPAIEQAIEAGMRGHEEALSAMSGEKRDEVIRDTQGLRGEAEDRFQDLRDNGKWAPTTPNQGNQSDQINNQSGADQFEDSGNGSSAPGNAGSQNSPIQP